MGWVAAWACTLLALLSHRGAHGYPWREDRSSENVPEAGQLKFTVYGMDYLNSRCARRAARWLVRETATRRNGSQVTSGPR